MAISPQTLDFLFQNRMQDSRTWFLEHKKEYEAYVKQPLRELAAALGPQMTQIDPLLETSPSRVVSRVNRDTRFTKDKSLYRDVMWLSYQRDKKEHPGGPGFFFEFGPEGIQYGCGFFHALPKTMDAMRELILKGSPLFAAAVQAVEGQDVFQMDGECYKRPRYGEQPEALRLWLERKNIFFIQGTADAALLYADDLHERLAKDFMLLKDVYVFLQQAYLASRR